jgi:hypothetical protein
MIVHGLDPGACAPGFMLSPAPQALLVAFLPATDLLLLSLNLHPCPIEGGGPSKSVDC